MNLWAWSQVTTWGTSVKHSTGKRNIPTKKGSLATCCCVVNDFRSRILFFWWRTCVCIFKDGVRPKLSIRPSYFLIDQIFSTSLIHTFRGEGVLKILFASSNPSFIPHVTRQNLPSPIKLDLEITCNDKPREGPLLPNPSLSQFKENRPFKMCIQLISAARCHSCHSGAYGLWRRKWIAVSFLHAGYLWSISDDDRRVIPRSLPANFWEISGV